MPYTKRPYGGKFASVMNPRSRPAAKSAQVARIAAAVDRSIKQQQAAVTLARNRGLNYSETKYFDVGINVDMVGSNTDWSDTEVPCDNYVNTSGAAAAYTDACLIPTAGGAGYGQVDGSRYKIKKLRIRGRIFKSTVSDAADMTQPIPVRLVLVEDTQPNGSQAQGELVFQDIGGAETTYAFQNTAQNSGRFRILKDQTFQIFNIVAGTDAANTNSLGYNGYDFSFTYKPVTPKLVNIKVGSATPNVSQTITSNMFLLLQSAGNTVTIQAASRCYYMD